MSALNFVAVYLIVVVIFHSKKNTYINLLVALEEKISKIHLLRRIEV